MSKIRIPVEKLPPPDKDGYHHLQFRVISEDRNRWSAWSPFNKVKSLGQYKPLEPDVTIEISKGTVLLTWDTPTIYNYSGSPSENLNVILSSSSVVVHNHSQNFKKHDTDIFISWDGGPYEYHDRVSIDNTSITIPLESTYFQIIGLIATYGLPVKGAKEDIGDFNLRVQDHIAYLKPMFKIFETDEIYLNNQYILV